MIIVLVSLAKPRESDDDKQNSPRRIDWKNKSWDKY